MSLDHLWAGWRSAYIRNEASRAECVLCRIATDPSDEQTHVIWRGESVYAVLNVYPYSTGHVMITPNRHVGQLEDLTEQESTELMDGMRQAVQAIKAAYNPDALNCGANLGKAAGAGFPDHLHMHIVPRWFGDTNFITTIAETRVLPEDLRTTADRLRTAWTN